MSKITCREFERIWHDRLDVRGESPVAEERALDDHAASCPACAEAAARFRTLAAALRAWGPPPAAPEGFADRVLAAHGETGRGWVVRFPAWRWAAAAAVIIVAGSLTLRSLLPRPGPARPVVAQGAAGPPRPLSAALADATLATLDLARETSAPAARIGRQMLATVAVGEGPALTLPASLGPRTDVLQSVGEGVRPLSGSARHAFGFLLGPAAKPRPAPARDRDA
jgi:hypothetical protein